MTKKQQNTQMLKEIIDYLYEIGAALDVTLYCNGRCYRTESHPNAKTCHTSRGNPYYDTGKKDVKESVEYNNPDSITMVFEGSLYDYLNYDSSGTVADILNRIGARYEQYFEMGDAWNLAFYPL